MDEFNDKENLTGEGPVNEPAVPAAPEGQPAAEEPQAPRPIHPQEPRWTEPAYEPVDDVRQRESYSPNHSSVSGDYAAYGTYTAPAEKPAKKKKSHGFLKAVCLILACVLLSSVSCYYIAGYVYDVKAKNAAAVTTGNTVVLGKSGGADESGKVRTTEKATGALSGETLTSEEIYAIAQEQVVGITTSVTTTNLFGQTTSNAVKGSGFVISSDGYIMTNYHVVEYAVAYGGDVTVMMNNGDRYDGAVVCANEENDVAVVKIDAQDLDAIEYNYDISVGEQIYAVGNPLGELAYSMTSGIVSALDRVITTTNASGVRQSINMFQIDAAVNSGNSGGPVYNAQGQVVGMVTAKYSSSGVEGLGFAIPIEDALNIATQLLEKGYVSGAYMGVKVQDITNVYSEFAIEYYGYPAGVCIMEVEEGSAAERAGIRVGDIVTAVDDRDVTSMELLKSVLKKYAPGDTAQMTLYRIGTTLDKGDYVTVAITFDETPATEENSAPQEQEDQNDQRGSGNRWNFDGYLIP